MIKGYSNDHFYLVHYIYYSNTQVFTKINNTGVTDHDHHEIAM